MAKTEALCILSVNVLGDGVEDGQTLLGNLSLGILDHNFKVSVQFSQTTSNKAAIHLLLR